MATWSSGLNQLKSGYERLVSILVEPCLLKAYDIQLVNLSQHMNLERAEASNVHGSNRDPLGTPSLNTPCPLATPPIGSCSPSPTSTKGSLLLTI